MPQTSTGSQHALPRPHGTTSYMDIPGDPQGPLCLWLLQYWQDSGSSPLRTPHQSKVGTGSESAVSNQRPPTPARPHPQPAAVSPLPQRSRPKHIDAPVLRSSSPRSPLVALCDTVAPAPHLQLLLASLSQATRHPTSILHLRALSTNRKVMAILLSRASLACEAHNQPYSNG